MARKHDSPIARRPRPKHGATKTTVRPPTDGDGPPPPPPPPPTIRSNARRACQLLIRIKNDQSPVASFFGMARLKGSALELHKLLKEEGGVRTGEGDIRRLFRSEPHKVRALLEQDAELPEKTVQAKTEFVSINSQFNKIVVTPLERSFRTRGRSKPDYDYLRSQAEMLLGQAREARSTLKNAVREAKNRHLDVLEADEPPPQFKVPGDRGAAGRRRKRHSQGRKKRPKGE